MDEELKDRVTAIRVSTLVSDARNLAQSAFRRATPAAPEGLDPSTADVAALVAQDVWRSIAAHSALGRRLDRIEETQREILGALRALGAEASPGASPSPPDQPTRKNPDTPSL